MWYSDKWKDYELLDATDGERLERWGKYILVRPDPQIVWHFNKSSPLWNSPSGVYKRSKSGGGAWVVSNMPEDWNISYGKLKFKLRPMGFKHTGLFPEQAVNWDWFSSLISRGDRVLNLFAYTGGATAAAAAAGAKVCHVDAAKGMVAAAKENLALSGLADAPVRYIVDDCMKFAQREKRRENKYEGIIMDPPSYGRGPGGEVWKIEDSAYDMIRSAIELLSDAPRFFLINSYTTGLSPSSMGYMLKNALPAKLKSHSRLDCDEIGLRVSSTSLVLPAGASARLTFE